MYRAQNEARLASEEGGLGYYIHACQPKGEIVVQLTFARIRSILPTLTTSPDELLVDLTSEQ